MVRRQIDIWSRNGACVSEHEIQQKTLSKYARLAAKD